MAQNGVVCPCPLCKSRLVIVSKYRELDSIWLVWGPSHGWIASFRILVLNMVELVHINLIKALPLVIELQLWNGRKHFQFPSAWQLVILQHAKLLGKASGDLAPKPSQDSPTSPNKVVTLVLPPLPNRTASFPVLSTWCDSIILLLSIYFP